MLLSDQQRKCLVGDAKGKVRPFRLHETIPTLQPGPKGRGKIAVLGRSNLGLFEEMVKQV